MMINLLFVGLIMFCNYKVIGLKRVNVDEDTRSWAARVVVEARVKCE